MTPSSSGENSESGDRSSESSSSSIQTKLLIRTKLYVSKFPEHCTRRNLTEFFSQFGQVQECAIMWNKYAFIHYNSVEEAQHAMRLACKERFMGRKLHIQLSTSSNRQSCDWYQKEAEKLLTPSPGEQDSEDSEECENSGRCVETKLYVTNLPEQCTQETLRELFGEHGEVLECVIMWNHYAFVHYSSLEQAKRAVKHLHGHTYGGKKLVVQLSTSSNRPLPKCIALKSKNGLDSIDDSSKSQSVERLEKPKEETRRNEETMRSSFDWIRALQSGSVPVVLNSQCEIDSSKNRVTTEEATTRQCIDLASIPTPCVIDSSSSGIKPSSCFKQQMTLFESVPEEESYRYCSQHAVVEKESSVSSSSSDEEIVKVGRDNDLLSRLNLLKLNNDTDSHLKSIWLDGGNGVTTTTTSTSSYTRSSSSSSGVYSETPSPVFSPVTGEFTDNAPPAPHQVTTPSLYRQSAHNNLTIDYLNQRCVYPENMIEKREPVAPFHTTTSFTHTICNVVNNNNNSYSLFPATGFNNNNEQHDELDDNLVDYEKTLIELLRKSCEI